MNKQGTIKKRRKKLKYYKLQAFKLLVFSSLTLFLAILVPFLPDTAVGFQYSGSTMIGLCIYAEVNLFVVKGILEPQKTLKLQTWQKRCSILSKICFIFGFLIFSYGDLVYNLI